MEHIKEYNMEYKAMEELKRITVNRGLIIISTPNTELLNNHGFNFDEINTLFKNNFKKYCIFENALYPKTGKDKILWEQRLAEGKTGVVITEAINFDETVLPTDKEFEVKKGIERGVYKFDSYDIDTSLLHNTHSWIVVAVNNK